MNNSRRIPPVLSPRKPEPAISRMVDFLLPLSTPFTLPASRRITRTSEQQGIWMVTDGVITLGRLIDDVHLGTVPTPHLFGLTESVFAQTEALFFMQTETTCSGGFIPQDVFLHETERQARWRDICEIQNWMLQMLIHRDQAMMGSNAYHIIRAQLLSLMNLPEAVRQNTTIEEFVRNRTRLSRSYTMKILSHLRQAGYIEVETGRLKQITWLPADY